MAKRPVYVPLTQPPFCREVNVAFAYNAGFAVCQKRKNIEAIHSAFLQQFPHSRPLEISSKSLQPLGVSLSAFFLMKKVPSIDLAVPVECVYHGAKKFAQGGPYTELYHAFPREAKRDERLNTSGPMCAFTFEGVDYPLEPKHSFYNWLYIQALLENRELAEQVLSYDAFTDIEFSPSRALNCQARAAAVFVGMTKAGLMDEMLDFDTFCRLTSEQAVVKEEEKGEKIAQFEAGQQIAHPAFGEGEIVQVNGQYIKARFARGEKLLVVDWVLEHCTAGIYG